MRRLDDGAAVLDLQGLAVDLDFDRIVTSKEDFDPDRQVVRSTQTVTEQNEASESAAQVTVQNNLPDSGQDAGGPRTTNRGNRTEETTNFEIAKTVTQHVREQGVIRRMTVAVLVDGKDVTSLDPRRIVRLGDQPRGGPCDRRPQASCPSRQTRRGQCRDALSSREWRPQPTRPA